MVDQSRAIAGGEDIVEADGLERIANFDEALLVAWQTGRSLAGRERGRIGTRGPDHQVGFEVFVASVWLGAVDGLQEGPPGVDPNNTAMRDGFDAAVLRFPGDERPGVWARVGEQLALGSDDRDPRLESSAA